MVRNNNNSSVVETTENVNGIIVVTVKSENSTRFYTLEADGRKNQLSKVKYFEMLGSQANKEMSNAKSIREVNSSMSYKDFTQIDRSKVDWFYWNQDNRHAQVKADKVLALMDEVYEVKDFVDESEDKVFVGGWIYKKDNVIGFISHHLTSKNNLDVTLYEEGNMPHWEQTKKSYIVSLFKWILDPNELVSSDYVSNYYLTPELTNEQEIALVTGINKIEDFSSEVQVYRKDVLGIDCLVHIELSDGNNSRVYFVEELSKPDTNEDAESASTTEEL